MAPHSGRCHLSSEPMERRLSFLAIASAAGVAVAVLAASLWLMMGRFVAVAPSAELQPLQLTTSPGVDLGGSFSPDGNSFVYSSNRSGWFDIFTRPVSLAEKSAAHAAHELAPQGLAQLGE